MPGKPPFPPVEYQMGDEVSYSVASRVSYGTVVRITGSGERQALEIEFEDGHKEMKRSRDRSVRLLRRGSGTSELEEKRGERQGGTNPEIRDVFRSDQRKR